MAITSAELKAYGATSRPETDVATPVGGAIDTASRPNLAQFSANAVAYVESDGADTRTVTVYGRDAAGALQSDPIVLNATTPVAGAVTFERILRVTLSATDGARTVLVKQGSGGTTRATILPNEDASFGMFIASQSEAGATTRYEKIFWKNTNGSSTLSSAEVTLTADPDSKIQIGIETAVDDTVTITNRESVPANPTFVDDDVAQAVPGDELAAGEAIGTWIEFSLGAGAAALKSSFTTQLAGTTV